MSDSANENARPGETGRAQEEPLSVTKTTSQVRFEDDHAARLSVRTPSFAQVRTMVNVGLSVVPLNGKTPRDPRWQLRAYDSAKLIAAAEGRHNLGIRIPRNLLVIDVDPRNGGDESFERLVADCGIDINHFPTVRTGGGGLHVYMWLPDGFEASQSVERYRGIDFKTSGQVVAPGSVHPDTGRPYVGERLELLALEMPAPEAVLAVVKRRSPASATAGDRAGEWSPQMLARNLAQLDPDEFASYDDWLHVMMASHHATDGAGLDEFVEWSMRYTGHDAASPELIEEKWRGFRASDRGVTLQYICKLLHDRCLPVHDRAEPEDDFDAVEVEPPKPESARWRFLSVGELESLPPPEWLVPGILVEGSIAAIYGAPESGKSFLAVDLSMSVASGIAWHGREVMSGGVLYVAAEGASGLGKRVRAWRVDKGAGSRELAFSLMRDPINVATEKEAREFARAVQRELGQLRLIVIDTLNQTATGADENSAQDMGRYIAGMKLLRDATGATVVVVHHSGKDAAKGMRGSTALLGAMDTTVEVERSTDGRSIAVKVQKQKDAEREPPIRFNLEKVGESLVLRPTVMSDAASDFACSPILEMACDMAEQRGGQVALKDVVAGVRMRDGVADKTARRRIAEAIPEGSGQAKAAGNGRAVWLERADDNPRGEVVVRVGEVPGSRAS